MYYLWLQEAQAGPYTLQQVQSMWNAGQITTETLYWQEGNPEWLPLSQIVSILEPPIRPGLLEKTAVLPPYEQTIPHRADKPAAPRATPEPAPAEIRPEQDLWTGHPTLWKWAWLLLLGLILILLTAGLFAFINPPLPVALAPLPIAFIIFVWIFIKRNTIRYTVTNKRVGVETGIFTKTSRELRLQDIRSIAARTNFLGYGDIEFSSAARDDADVIFIAVANATSVRDMVKKLQS